MTEEINNLETIVWKQWIPIMSVVKNIQRTKIQMLKQTIQNKLMLLSNCAFSGKKESTFIKNEELRNFD